MSPEELGTGAWYSIGNSAPDSLPESEPIYAQGEEQAAAILRTEIRSALDWLEDDGEFLSADTLLHATSHAAMVTEIRALGRYYFPELIQGRRFWVERLSAEDAAREIPEVALERLTVGRVVTVARASERGPFVVESRHGGGADAVVLLFREVTSEFVEITAGSLGYWGISEVSE